jgi:hypothetical protein
MYIEDGGLGKLRGITVFILPLVCISRLPMSRAQKISAGLTFGLGFIAIGITVMRWFIVHSPFAPSTAFAVDGKLLATFTLQDRS